MDPCDVATTVSTHCLGLRIRLIERAVTGIFAAHLKPHDITVPQVTLLVAISQRPGCRAADLAESLVLSRSTLSRNLDRMKQLGWLSMVAGHKRALHVSLTEAGNTKLTSVFDDWQAAQREVESALGAHGEAVYEMAQALSNGHISTP